MSRQQERRRGRPLDDSTTGVILDATLELWGEVGFAAVTIDAVAARAGVSKPTVYRRWSAKRELLITAIERFVAPADIPDLGSFKAEVTEFLRNRGEMYRSPRVRRIMAGMIAACTEDEEFHGEVQPFIDRFPAAMRLIIQRGIARGEVRPDTDVELLAAMINGSFYYRSIIEQKGVDERSVEFVVGMIMAAVPPGTERDLPLGR
ncbi:TetR/AcrR family transcriptional regulator [Streptomyces sp. NBC_00344]|uniref:TetR/AcrR family transcriptional regulator n=1 Tax=Streptomyces sp. NBC_00344 TaxID=2975720 RepID=UPI002E1D252F